jgi:MFS transporter, DHA1 family, tetracycline resistance protein
VKKASLGAIFLTMFLDILGFSLVLPFLAEEARSLFGVSTFTASLLGASYSLMQFLFVPLWGRTSDTYGRRPVLVWSVLATAVGMLGLFTALIYGTNVGYLFAARMFSGIATANLGTASAYIADVTKPEERAKGMGLIGIAFGLGFILGPALGGLTSDLLLINGRKGGLPCLIAAGLSFVNFAWVFLRVGESLPPDKRSTSTRKLVPLDIAALAKVLARPELGAAIFVNFLVILFFTCLDQTFRFFNADLFGLSARGTGLVFGFIGVCAAFVQGGLVRRLSGKVAEAKMLRVGVLVQVFAFAGLALAPSFGLGALLGACALLALGNGLSQPSASAFISKQATGAEQGEVLGTNQGMAALARTIGPALGGFLYYQLGPRAPYWSAALGMCLALLATLMLRAAPKISAPAR